ncbi:PD-(D/E)XK motif protein [Pseudomonas gingeri]|uniref:PD-(D/E)XK motif protein n=1 Tax=Pseudomonas gingeri TaxID=117681 RepID=UPI0015A1803A|nr:PD-(D/E)XK motif protein [Pseudomonas gingeri]NWD74438.1 PD-(D/E)XK motif protein [Pseudomonas gingeri]
MAALSSTDLLGIWRALSGNASTPGWRSIDLFQSGTCRVKAARHAPGNEEAILIGFSSAKIAPASQFPQGQGFRIERAASGDTAAEYQWLAIVRQPAGSLELFTAVVRDICGLLDASDSCSEDLVYQRLLGRVRGWQEFMRRGREGLSPEAELGLVGELCLLRYLLEEGVLLFSAVRGWKGPLDGLYDFRLGTGAIEVKSTMATEGFPVRIASLDQLDDSQCPPLFLAALRFGLNDSGLSLPETVEDMRRRLELDPAATRLFELALHSVGYLDMQAENYSRRFSLREMRIHLVESEFPKLAPYSIPAAIRRAQYELDLALISADNHPLLDVLEQLGVV